MPEIPDLEAIRGFFNERIVGLEITEAEVTIPVVVRTGATDFVATMTGNRAGTTLRQGKFLLMALADEHVLVINAMLTGRFQYTDPKPKKRARTCFTLTFENGMQLRYSDQLLMGKVYLVPADKVMTVPMFAEMGPDALEVSEEEFRSRIKKFTGQIKNVLTNHKFIAGIGNAYYRTRFCSRRGSNPFRKRSTMNDGDIGRLYRAISQTFDRSIPILARALPR